MSRYPGATYRQLTQYWPRTFDAWILGVGHITANPGNPIATAAGEIAWRAGDRTVQNSATYFIDRDGSIHQALDPATQVAWTNGDVRNPDMSQPQIARILAERVNANRACYFTAEMVGREPEMPVTDAQLRSFGDLLRHHAPEAGLPIGRATVKGHRDFNSVSRFGCPTSGDLDALLARAITYATGLPDTATEEPDVYEWVPDITHQVPKLAVVRKGAVLLKNPDGTEHYTLPGAIRVEVIGGLPGWLWVARREDGGGLFLVRNDDVSEWIKEAAPAPADCTEQDAKLAAVSRSLPSLRAANKAESVALEALAKEIA